MFRSNHLWFATAANFCCTSPDPRGFHALQAQVGTSARENVLNCYWGSSGCKLHPTPSPCTSHGRQRLLKTVAADPCVSLSTPLSSHLSTQLEVHSEDWNILPLLQTNTLSKDKTSPPRSYPALGNSPPSLPPFQRKIKPLGYLGRAWFGDSRRGERRGSVGPEPGPGQSPGGYLGAEGG